MSTYALLTVKLDTFQIGVLAHVHVAVVSKARLDQSLKNHYMEARLANTCLKHRCATVIHAPLIALFQAGAAGAHAPILVVGAGKVGLGQ